MKRTREIFGADFDIPSGSDKVDALEKLKFLAPLLGTAEDAYLINVGQLTQKDAYRIRIKGIRKIT